MPSTPAISWSARRRAEPPAVSIGRSSSATVSSASCNTSTISGSPSGADASSRIGGSLSTRTHPGAPSAARSAVATRASTVAVSSPSTSGSRIGRRLRTASPATERSRIAAVASLSRRTTCGTEANLGLNTRGGSITTAWPGCCGSHVRAASRTPLSVTPSIPNRYSRTPATRPPSHRSRTARAPSGWLPSSACRRTSSRVRAASTRRGIEHGAVADSRDREPELAELELGELGFHGPLEDRAFRFEPRSEARQVARQQLRHQLPEHLDGAPAPVVRRRQRHLESDHAATIRAAKPAVETALVHRLALRRPDNGRASRQHAFDRRRELGELRSADHDHHRGGRFDLRQCRLDLRDQIELAEGHGPDLAVRRRPGDRGRSGERLSDEHELASTRVALVVEGLRRPLSSAGEDRCDRRENRDKRLKRGTLWPHDRAMVACRDAARAGRSAPEADAVRPRGCSGRVCRRARAGGDRPGGRSTPRRLRLDRSLDPDRPPGVGAREPADPPLRVAGARRWGTGRAPPWWSWWSRWLRSRCCRGRGHSRPSS